MAKKQPTPKHRIIGLSMRAEEYDEIEARATSMGLTRAGYMKIIIRRFMESGEKLTLQEE